MRSTRGATAPRKAEKKSTKAKAKARGTGLQEVFASSVDVDEVLEPKEQNVQSPGRQPDTLTTIRQQNALVRGATTGTMLRNDIYNFCRLGTFVERADNTARILDVKYYVLLPSASFVGSSMDNAQWENILRSVSAERAFSWLNGGEITPVAIAEFLLLV